MAPTPKDRAFFSAGGGKLCLVVAAIWGIGFWLGVAFGKEAPGGPSQEFPSGSARTLAATPVRVPIDPQRIAAFGIRRLDGKHVTLYTDLGPDPEVDVLPEVFDQAFPQWCAYFQVDVQQHRNWKMTGRLMRQKERFQQAGLLPDDLPNFPHGFTKSYDFWIYEQPSAYYRRHLMLHEGTHGWMLTILGSCGPTWYMEGVAELLSTHCWQEGKLRLNYFPRASEEVPMWGRVKIVQNSVKQRGILSVEALLRTVPQMTGEKELYGWCWALAAFLDGHPHYQARFRQLPAWVRSKDFTERFFQSLGQDRSFLDEQWKLFIDELCYGFDLKRTQIDFVAGRPIPALGAEVRVEADRGWQSSAWRVERGQSYRLTASGRYQLANQPQIWWCEPGGVTIRYYRGRPLGMLLAAIRPEAPDPSETSPAKAEKKEASEPKPPQTGLLHPVPVGLEATLRPTVSGTLYFRINESPASLYDNAGSLVVRIQPEPSDHDP